MDPIEVELGRLRENNQTLVDFIKSAGMVNAYKLYRLNLGLNENMDSFLLARYASDTSLNSMGTAEDS